jgi:carbonic anhydrase/acetyltransferase-like protein (isoleucine patch superfamily)
MMFFDKLDCSFGRRGSRGRQAFILLMWLAFVLGTWLSSQPRPAAASLPAVVFSDGAIPVETLCEGSAFTLSALLDEGATADAPRRLRINGRVIPAAESQPETQRRLRINGRAINTAEPEAQRRLRINGRGFRYQWKKDGQEIPGATGDRLSFASISAADAGDYSVTVTDSAGLSISDALTLAVNLNPVLRLRANRQTVPAGERVTLSVSAESSLMDVPRRLRINQRAARAAVRPEAAYQWKKNGEVVPGATGNALTIDGATAADEGDYTVTVAGACGAVTSNAETLEVFTAPSTSFMDPGASLGFKGNIHISELVYIGPFATLRAGYIGSNRHIDIGAESNVQDNAMLDADVATVSLGKQATVAHGATVRGAFKIVGFRRLRIPARVGIGGKCPKDEANCPSYVGFNALVEGATIEQDAMVGILARVGPEVTIPSGYKVLPGKNITSNADVTLESGKVAPITEADREFMRGAVEVNCSLAEQYAALAAEDASFVRGINYDPGRNPGFNLSRDLPTHQGVTIQDPTFRNRIIGDIRLEDDRQGLERVMAGRISLRADEGDPFEIGRIASMGDGVTFHALPHTRLFLGDGGRYGARSIVHGGPTDFPGLENNTVAGDGFTLGDGAVFYRSRAARNARIGARSLVQQSDLPDDTVVPDRRIILGNSEFGAVEW